MPFIPVAAHAGLGRQHPAVIDPDSARDLLLLEMFIKDAFADRIHQNSGIDRIRKRRARIEYDHHPVANDAPHVSSILCRTPRDRANEGRIKLGNRLRAMFKIEGGGPTDVNVKNRRLD